MTPGPIVVASVLALLSGAALAQDAGGAGGSAAPSGQAALQRALDEVNGQTSGPAPVIRREAPGFFGPGFYIGVERAGRGPDGDRFGVNDNRTTYQPAESDALLRR